MAKTITIDSLSLLDLTLVQRTAGKYAVTAIFNLLSNGQVVATLNRDVTGLLDAPSLSALAAAFSAVQAAVFAAQP